MQRKFSLRRTLIAVHKYAGLFAGVVIVVLGLTGSVSVYWRELQEALDERYVVHPGTQWASYDAIMTSVNTSFPNRSKAWYLDFPWYPEGTLYAVYHEPEERADEYEAPLYVAVDPYTAKVIGHYYWGDTLVSWLYNLHSHLNAGLFGLQVVGIFGIVFLFLALSGLYLWWPVGRFNRRHFTTSPRYGAATFEFDLHRVGGFYAFLVLTVVAATGATIIYAEPIGRFVDRIAPMNTPLGGEGEHEHNVAAPQGARLSPDEAVAQARKLFPNATVRGLFAPGDRSDAAYGAVLRQPGEIFTPHYPDTQVWVDRNDGAVLSVVDPMRQNASRRLMDVYYEFHNGEALGSFGRALVCLAGFMPLLLFVTGLRQWLRIRRRVQAQSASSSVNATRSSQMS
jgi:uncharacterized iron-regulated membrane protein